MFIESVILGAIQGLTEFLPISSSAHLVLVPHFFRFESSILNSTMFDAILHGGSLVAIILFFWRDLINLKNNKKLVYLIILACIPTFVIALLIEPFKDKYLREVSVIGINMIIFSIYILIAEKKNKETVTTGGLKPYHFIFLGFMQSLALIPGTSRSGVTIASAYLLNLKKEEAVSVSFLIGIPVILLAFLYELKKALFVNQVEIIPTSVILGGISSSLLFGLVALFILVKFVKRYKFAYFAYYRFFVAFLIFYDIWKS
ncbi:MAG: undecaprenyl-diphosphate phosphatase [Proteobacteria bacterium]|nr:undecaprenyl-diphosphate phosphatase [Pseudomonadota bacterium]